MPDEMTQFDEMVYVGEDPWHRKGIAWEGPGLLTVDRALEIAAPWTVSKRPLYAATLPDGTGDLIEIPGRYATFRDDVNIPLGIVTESYEVFQNREGFDLTKAVLAESRDIEVETAGTLRDGRIVWLLCKLDRDLTIGGDEHLPYLLFFTSHDGSYAVTIQGTIVRVVCKNTLDMAISGVARAWRAVHTRNVSKTAADARTVLEMGWRYVDAFEQEVMALQRVDVTDHEFTGIVEHLFPAPAEPSKRAENFVAERRELVHGLWKDDPRVGSFRGTGWGVVQAFSTYELWIRRVRGDRAERQMVRSLNGAGGRLSEQARALITAEA